MVKGEQISIWLFIGTLMLIYGALIMISGIIELYSPPSRQVVLGELHAPIWWGGLMAVLGAIYVYLFSPGRQRRSR